MKEIITIELDIAKSVFQVHAIDATGDVVTAGQRRRTLTERRQGVNLIGRQDQLRKKGGQRGQSHS